MRYANGPLLRGSGAEDVLLRFGRPPKLRSSRSLAARCCCLAEGRRRGARRTPLAPPRGDPWARVPATAPTRGGSVSPRRAVEPENVSADPLTHSRCGLRLRKTPNCYHSYGSSPRVLVVDDDPSILRLAQLNLEADGFEVTFRTTGRRTDAFPGPLRRPAARPHDAPARRVRAAGAGACHRGGRERPRLHAHRRATPRTWREPRAGVAGSRSPSIRPSWAALRAGLTRASPGPRRQGDPEAGARRGCRHADRRRERGRSADDRESRSGRGSPGQTSHAGSARTRAPAGRTGSPAAAAHRELPGRVPGLERSTVPPSCGT